MITNIKPDEQSKYVKDPNSAFLNGQPTLEMLDMAYGEGSAKAWLTVEIYDIMEFCGCKHKMDELQINNLTSLICAQYKHYTISEMLLFVGWFKLGRYGKFYGSEDPMVITEALTVFAKERSVKMNAIMKEKEEKKEIKPTYDTSYDAYCARHNIKPIPSIALKTVQIQNKQKNEYPPEKILAIAEELTFNINNFPERDLNALVGNFTRRYGLHPKDYYKQHKMIEQHG